MEPPIEPDDRWSAQPQSGLHELPLFPIDLVLFPGMKVSLHIAEERYREMVQRCLAESRLFGVVLFSPDQPPEQDIRKFNTYRIGCSARILEVDPLAEDHMHIEIEGVERFRIVEQHEVELYRTGIVEPVLDTPMSETKQEVVEELSDEVERLLREFLTRQLAQIGQRILEFELPEDRIILSFIAGCVLPVENDEKQKLLETTDTEARLDTEREELRRAVTRLRRAAAAGQGNEEGDVVASFDDDDAEDPSLSFEPIRSERYRDYLCPN